MLGKIAATIALLAMALGIGGVAVCWTFDPPHPWPWFMWPMIVLFDLGLLVTALGALLAIWVRD